MGARNGRRFLMTQGLLALLVAASAVAVPTASIAATPAPVHAISQGWTFDTQAAHLDGSRTSPDGSTWLWTRGANPATLVRISTTGAELFRIQLPVYLTSITFDPLGHAFLAATGFDPTVESGVAAYLYRVSTGGVADQLKKFALTSFSTGPVSVQYGPNDMLYLHISNVLRTIDPVTLEISEYPAFPASAGEASFLQSGPHALHLYDYAGDSGRLTRFDDLSSSIVQSPTPPLSYARPSLGPDDSLLIVGYASGSSDCSAAPYSPLRF